MIAEYMRGSRGRDYMVVGYLQLPVQSASINCIVVSSNPVHGEAYLIQHYLIKFVKRLAACRWFSSGTLVSYTNKTARHDITKILLKVTLSTIKPKTKPEYMITWLQITENLPV